jgi:hypothetical protein
MDTNLRFLKFPPRENEGNGAAQTQGIYLQDVEKVWGPNPGLEIPDISDEPEVWPMVNTEGKLLTTRRLSTSRTNGWNRYNFPMPGNK